MKQYLIKTVIESKLLSSICWMAEQFYPMDNGWFVSFYSGDEKETINEILEIDCLAEIKEVE